MTKKHFEALALALKDSKPPSACASRSRQWHQDVGAIASMCGMFNAAFDINKFVKACGWTEGAEYWNPKKEKKQKKPTVQSWAD